MRNTFIIALPLFCAPMQMRQLTKSNNKENVTPKVKFRIIFKIKSTVIINCAAIVVVTSTIPPFFKHAAPHTHNNSFFPRMGTNHVTRSADVEKKRTISARSAPSCDAWLTLRYAICV